MIYDMTEDVHEAYKKDFQNGVISVGNVCSADCFFCTMKWNPPGVIKDLKRFLTMKEIKHFANLYLDKVKWMGTGYHINSGEFFLHPNATEILKFLAASNKLFDNTEIFSNGMDLTVKHIMILKKLKLHLHLSLNSTDIATRKRIMGGSYLKNKNALNSINILNKNNVDYRVRIVPLRSTLDNGDLENTIRYLKNAKVKFIQIHRPGYTRYTPSRFAKELSIPEKELFLFVAAMRDKYKINVRFKPPTRAMRSKQIIHMLSRLFNNPKYLNRKEKLFLYAESVKDIFPSILKEMKIQKYEIKAVKSKVFGGNINCAGLLLVEDYICAMEDFLEQKQNKKPEIAILPSTSFDINTEDLSMTSVKEIENRCKIKLILA